MYYENKIEILCDLFNNKNIKLNEHSLIVGKMKFPILDDVIILLDPVQYPPTLKSRLEIVGNDLNINSQDFAEDIQYTFGQEWKTYNNILHEHENEFKKYFDIADLNELKNSRICDLGCGIGRWAYFLRNKVREMVLVDFSEAIFEARQNLSDSNNILFFMADLKRLPFRNDFADFLYCIGVLHHLPTPSLQEVRY